MTTRLGVDPALPADIDGHQCGVLLKVLQEGLQAIIVDRPARDWLEPGQGRDVVGVQESDGFITLLSVA